MTPFPYRKRIVTAALGAALLYLGGWYLRDVVPVVRALDAAEVELEQERATTRAARQASLRMGEDGLQAEIERLRREIERRETLAPLTSVQAPEVGALQIRDQIGLLAKRYGVDASYIVPVEATSEGGIRTDGFRVRLTGGYHAVGALMTDLLSLSRLTRVVDARLVPVPDSLVSDRTWGQGGELQSLAPSGRPLDAIAEFTLQWYSLDPSSDGVDGKASGVEAAAEPSDPVAESFDEF